MLCHIGWYGVAATFNVSAEIRNDRLKKTTFYSGFSKGDQVENCPSFLRGMPWRGIPCLKTGRFLFLRGMPWGGIPCLKTGRFLFFFFSSSWSQIGTLIYSLNSPLSYSGCIVLIVFTNSRPIKIHSCRLYRLYRELIATEGTHSPLPVWRQRIIWYIY